jgi:hypothetical protein
MPPEVETNDLRSTIEDAYDAAESEAGRPTENAPESVRPASEASTPAAKPAAEDRGDGRRVDGKFARKAAAVDDAGKPADPNPADPAALAGDETKPAVEQKADPYSKAPQSWKPGAREAWGQLPPDVRAEVHRREREAHHVMQETTQARQVHDYLGQLQQKYAPALQAEGVDVLTASANLMELSSKLRFGTQPEKAALAAQIIRNYGVDVNALADALDGRPVPQGQQQQQPMLQDPRVDQLLAQLQGLTQSRQEAVQQKAVGEVESFGGDKEFFEDVREDMADLLEVAARRGIDLSLEQAYERACKMQPDIAKVLEAREAAQRAGTGRRSTQQARAAASSVRGSPGSGPSSQPDNLRASIEAAIEQVGGR